MNLSNFIQKYWSYVTDPRTKGFSQGILHSDTPKFFYSLMDKLDSTPVSEKNVITRDICTALRLLATKTSFFGGKFCEALDIMRNDDILFIGALLIRTFGVLALNVIKVNTC